MNSGAPEPDAPTMDPSVENPYVLEARDVCARLDVGPHGLSPAEARARLERFGRNALPRARLPGPLMIFIWQFLSPLIYILLIAALVSLFLKEWSDAGFIFAVLLINAIIGTFQEYHAQRSAEALRQLVVTRARVERDGESYEIDAEELVPGDIVFLESGAKVPADLRLVTSQDLEVDESLLTGESLPVFKDSTARLQSEAPLGERVNMAFAGTLVSRGRGRGVVTSTATRTELGKIAKAVAAEDITKPPLVLRMERFTAWVGMVVFLFAALLAVVGIARGIGLAEIFFLSVALAVSAIPEGLPVALTVTLAIGMSRMARRHVIVRRLVAVESLGSCTFIASDKTGTLTINQLTARRVVFPQQELPWRITGEGMVPEGEILPPAGTPAGASSLLARFSTTAVLCNEAFLGRQDSTGWVHQGDMVDVALLVMAHKGGIKQAESVDAYPPLAAIPFESERLFAASLNQVDGETLASVKGAFERVLTMCSAMATVAGEEPMDRMHIERQAEELAEQGYRVLGLANGRVTLREGEVFSEEHLKDLVFLGLVGLMDPPRTEAKAALAACQQAGVEVSMITGDHPVTSLAVARELGLAEHAREVIAGRELRAAIEKSEEALDGLVRRGRVFARVEPRQKLDIMYSLGRLGHFVAMTGDGANDAPALRAAHVGVAMGKQGTDVAREASELIITDDNFASIVAGVEEGRVAFANVRKVIFLLVSTAAAEIVLFTLALFTGQPLPLVAVQLLWLNLVTNGIQDIALAFEPAEGGEMQRPPRSPKEPIFNRLMVERVVVSAVVMGVAAFMLFQSLLNLGWTEFQARNATLLLMVLFENVHVFNCRSETRSALRHNPLRNPLLLFGTLAAQGIHIAAMYTPGLREVLGVEPVTVDQWLQLLGIALVMLVAMELHKLVWRWRGHKTVAKSLA